MKAKMNSLTSIRLLLAALLLVVGGSQASAWDTTPDDNGKYDGLYDRPTHFLDWSQPSTWPNAMYCLCEVRVGEEGPRLQNYEIAVYDQNDQLRHCARSIARDEDLCVLTIRGTEGDTFHFQVVYGDDFANPTIADVADVTLSFKTNEIVGSNDAPFCLIIPGRTYLRETDTDAPAAKTGADVTVMRTINAGEWSTICLPFAIPEDGMSQAFGTQVQLGDFTGCDVTYEDDGETVKHINVKFEDATAIEANHPYIIKVEDDVTEINADGVDIIALDEDEAASVDCDPYPYQVQVGKNKFETHYWYNSFVGNYENGFLVPDKTLFLSGGKFWYSTGKTPMMAFRAYFDFYEVLPEVDSSGAHIAMTFDDDTTTGIGLQTSDFRPQADDAWFTLDGRKCSGLLNKGIYINNGKKIRPVRLKSPEGATRLQTGVKPPVSRHKTKALKGR